MNETQILPLIVQAGAVGISLCLIYLLYHVFKLNNKLISNHINHSTEVQRQLTKAVSKLSSVIESLDRRLLAREEIERSKREK